MKIKTFQWNVSTIVGILIMVGAGVMLFLDMYLSTKEVYTFDLERSDVWKGLGVGFILMVMPQDFVIESIVKLRDKWTK